MNPTFLIPPEVVHAPFGRPGWTVVRGGRDEQSAFELWIGQNFPTYAEAEEAARLWEERQPSTEGGPQQ
jgi:hypothetical protein